PGVMKNVTQATDKPIVGFIRMHHVTGKETVAFQDEVGFPFLQGLPAAIRALSSLAFYGARKGRRIASLPAPSGRVETLADANFAAAPAAPIGGFLVQEMVEGTEILLGARTDPLYGPLMVVGSGGILVELINDVACRLLPVTAEDARAMIGELKLARLLAGFRGKPP